MKILLLLAIVLLVTAQTTHIQGRGRSETDESNRQSIKLHPMGDPWGCWKDEEYYPNEALAIPPLVISPDRLLVTACNTLYMLKSDGEVLWLYSTYGPAITAQPVIDSTGTIYVIAYDLIWVALDASTGVKKWNATGNGRAVYSQMKPYGKDQYLVVINMEGYRYSLDDPAIQDRILLCKGEETLSRAAFPPNATLEVWGDRILAVTHKEDGVEIKEIKME